MQKVPMTMVDYIGALIKYFSKYTEDEIELTSEDMKRCLPPDSSESRQR